MVAKYHKHVAGSSVPVTERVRSDQVKNSAGGYVFAVSDWDRFSRFLVLGSEGGSYYVSEARLTRENCSSIEKCLAEDPARAIGEIVSVSDAGRAPKNDPALFALAVAASSRDAKVRAMALEALPEVARIGTHLFTFVEYVNSMRGWGRGLRNAVAKWYTEKPADRLAYQVIKYQQRNGWSHKNVITLSHAYSKSRKVSPETTAVLKYALGKDDVDAEFLPDFVKSIPSRVDSVGVWVKAIREHNLPREVVPTELLNDTRVWEALLEKMPMTALVRNLGKIAALGFTESNTSEWTKRISSELTDVDRIKASRAHPMLFLVASRVYSNGSGVRSAMRDNSMSWKANSRVLESLEEAFELAFGNVQPTGKDICLALDVSGSMTAPCAGSSAISCRDASAAMALVTARVEKSCDVVAFTTSLKEMSITKRTSLSSLLDTINRMNFGGTDVSLPLKRALDSVSKMKYDGFVTYTDSETWAGGHVHSMLRDYRKKSGRDSKFVVVGMASNGFTVADPTDPGMLDVVGFDTTVPGVISEFI